MQFLTKYSVLDSAWIVVIGRDQAVRTARFVPGATGRRVGAIAVAVFNVLALLANSLIRVGEYVIAISLVTV